MQRYQKHCNIQIFYRNFFEKKTYFVKKDRKCAFVSGDVP